MPHIMTTRRSFLVTLGGAMLAPSVARAAQKATAFALIGDRYHNSDYIRVGLSRTIQSGLGVSIDFCDETNLLNADTLEGYKLLIILRDGMVWPDGYPDETTNAGWVATGRPPLTFEPPTPRTDAKPQFWMKPEQGKAVRPFVEKRRIGAVPAQRHARRAHRRQFPSRARGGVCRPSAHSHLQGESDEPESSDYQGRPRLRDYR